MKKPLVGTLVEVEWIDSGADMSSVPVDTAHLFKCVTRGKVVKVGPCPVVEKTIVVLEMCSSGPTLGVILWRDVLSVRVLR